jgi:hypothetical protein
VKCWSSLSKLPADLKLRVAAYGCDGSVEHQAIFLQELGKVDPAAFRNAIRTESPRSVFVIDLDQLEPTSEIAAGIRGVLSTPGLFRVNIARFANAENTDEAKRVKEAWISWLLQEWNAKTIPQGREDTSRNKQTPDATDRTNPFELLMSLGVDIAGHFDELARPNYDGQRARLIDEWCGLRIQEGAIVATYSKLPSYGPIAFRAGIECAAHHRGRANWIRPIANAIEIASDDLILNTDTFGSLCTGNWEAGDRKNLAQALSKRGSSGQVLSALFLYTGTTDHQQRIALLAEAFAGLTRLSARVLEEGEISYAFVIAADMVRSSLNLKRDNEAQKSDLISLEIDEAAQRTIPPPTVRSAFEGTRARAKEGVRRWAFSI